MKRKQRKLISRLVVVGLILLVGVGAVAFMGKDDEKTVEYTEYTVESETLENSYSFTGVIDSDNETKVISLENQTIKEIRVEEGDLVNADTVLFVNDNGDRIYADGAGTIDIINVVEDQMVQSGAQLAKIKDLTDMKVTMNVDEYDIQEISLNDEIEITVNATDEVVYGHVSDISNTATNQYNLAYFEVTVELDPTEKVKVGMNVEAALVKERVVNVPVITMNAINIGENNQAYVLLKNESGEMYEQNVELGLVSGNKVEIKSGLSVGDVVYFNLLSKIPTVSGDMSSFPMIGMGGGGMTPSKGGSSSVAIRPSRG